METKLDKFLIGASNYYNTISPLIICIIFTLLTRLIPAMQLESKFATRLVAIVIILCVSLCVFAAIGNMIKEVNE